MILKPQQFQLLLRQSLTSALRQPSLLVTGPPGVGKTAQIGAVCADLGFSFYPIPAACLLPMEPFGALALPGPGEDRARRVLVAEFASAIKDSGPDRPAYILLDDLPQADVDVQKACMRLLHATDNELPPWVHVGAAGNGRTHRADVRGILAPVRNRVRSVELGVDVDSWILWACDAMPHAPAVPAYHRWGAVANREGVVHASLCADVPATDEPYPTPRSWESVGRTELLDLPDDVRFAAVAGDVGEGEAAAYLAFRQSFSDVVFADEVFADPHGAPLPARSKPALASGLVAGLTHRLGANPTSAAANAVATYLGRMADAGWNDFAAYGLILISKQDQARTAFALCAEANKLRANPAISGIVYGSDHN